MKTDLNQSNNKSNKSNTINNNLVLELHIPDFDKARNFYSLFGFKEITYDPTSGGGSTLGYMVLKRTDRLGNTLINFYGDSPLVSEHSYFKDFDKNTPRGYEVEITVPVSEVNKLWEEVKGQLQEKNIAQSLTLKRWGKSDFRVIDPFGFYIRFTEIVDWGQ
jgi:hypothetical protein